MEVIREGDNEAGQNEKSRYKSGHMNQIGALMKKKIAHSNALSKSGANQLGYNEDLSGDKTPMSDGGRIRDICNDEIKKGLTYREAAYKIMDSI